VFVLCLCFLCWLYHFCSDVEAARCKYLLNWVIITVIIDIDILLLLILLLRLLSFSLYLFLCNVFVYFIVSVLCLFSCAGTIIIFCYWEFKLINTCWIIIIIIIIITIIIFVVLSLHTVLFLYLCCIYVFVLALQFPLLSLRLFVNSFPIELYWIKLNLRTIYERFWGRRFLSFFPIYKLLFTSFPAFLLRFFLVPSVLSSHYHYFYPTLAKEQNIFRAS